MNEYLLQGGASKSDIGFDNLEVSLTSLTPYDSGVAKVELEDTNEAGMKDAAIERMEELLSYMFNTGVVLWILTLVGGLIAGLKSDCATGTQPQYFAIPLIAALILLYRLNTVTILLSQTTLEGKYLVKMILDPTGMDRYHVVAIIQVVDMIGKFTRTSFVGYAIVCGEGISDILTQSFESSSLAFLAPLVHKVGLGGMAALFLIVGPVYLQGGYALYCRSYVKRTLEVARDDARDASSTGIVNCVDELGALAKWAMLDPAYKVLMTASFPNTLDDANDAIHAWETIRTKSVLYALKFIPDNILQMSCQARFFALAYPNMDLAAKANILLLAFIPAGADTLNAAVELFTLNNRLTVLTAFIMCFFLSFPCIRMLAAFACESSLFNLSSFSCVPLGMVHRGNFTAGIVSPT